MSASKNESRSAGQLCTHQVIDCLMVGVCGGVEAKQACVMVVSVEGHVRVCQIVDGHALGHEAAAVGSYMTAVEYQYRYPLQSSGFRDECCDS